MKDFELPCMVRVGTTDEFNKLDRSLKEEKSKAKLVRIGRHQGDVIGMLYKGKLDDNKNSELFNHLDDMCKEWSKPLWS